MCYQTVLEVRSPGKPQGKVGKFGEAMAAGHHEQESTHS